MSRLSVSLTAAALALGATLAAVPLTTSADAAPPNVRCHTNGPLGRSTIQGHAILDGRTIRAGDLVATPMLQNGATAGVIVVRRGNSRSFSSAQADRLGGRTGVDAP